MAVVDASLMNVAAHSAALGRTVKAEPSSGVVAINGKLPEKVLRQFANLGRDCAREFIAFGGELFHL